MIRVPRWAGAERVFYAGFTNEAVYHMQIAHALEPSNVINYSTPLGPVVEFNHNALQEATPILKSVCAIQTNDPEDFNMSWLRPD